LENFIHGILKESISLKENFIGENTSNLILLAEKVVSAFTGDRKLMICGNGGSAADSQHIAAEFVNKISLERPPLPAMALTTDSSIITSIGNDYSFNEIFSKQIKALGMDGDVLLAISTSGNSENLLSAVKDARIQGMYTAAFLGKDGGKLAGIVDLAIIAKGQCTARIQESHILAGHILCELVDHMLFQGHMTNETV